MINTRDSAICVAKCMLMGGALFAGQTSIALTQTYPYSVNGTYNVDAEARDDFGSEIGVTTVADYHLQNPLPNPNNVVDFDITSLGAEVLNSISAVNLGIHAKVGEFHVSTSVNANSARLVHDLPFQICEAQGYATASVNISDTFTLRSKIPGAKIINTKWTISGDLGANTIGKVRSDDFIYDYITSTAESWLSVTGTGIAPQPNPGFDIPFDFPTYLSVPGKTTAVSYAASGGQSPPTIDQYTRNPPTQVPISFEVIPGVPLQVSWSLAAGSAAAIQNFDLSDILGSGSANTSGRFDHTVDWGGITSVVDEATGQPITDWSVDSASGFDYAHAVPEPGSLLMALSACALLILGNDRRLACGPNR